MAVTRPVLVGRVFRHPLVLLPVAVAVWSLLTLPFASFASLSWFGSPELGEGVLWYLDIAVLCAGAMVLRPLRVARLAIAGVALFSTFVASALTYHSDLFSVSLLNPFSDHLAFHGLFLPLIIVTAAPRQIRSQALALAAGFVIISLSQNKSALLLSLAAPLIWLTVRQIGGGWMSGRALAVILVAVTPVAVTIAVALVGEKGAEQPWWGPFSLLTHWSRSLLQDVVLASIGQEPSTLLTGRGWGQFTDTLLAHAHGEGVTLIAGADLRPNWDALVRIDFHSHNQLADALLAGGVVSMLLLWVILVALVLYSRACYRLVVTITAVVFLGLSCVWFQFPGSIPFMAIAFGLAARPIRSRWRPSTRTVSITLAGLVLVQSLSIAAAWIWPNS